MPRDGAGPHLFPGSRVAIVGGGPAASFAALHLLRFARQLGLSVSVVIFEPPTPAPIAHEGLRISGS